MLSKNTNTHSNHQQNSNQFTFECKKCRTACRLYNKLPPTWICSECNIIQEQKQPIYLKDSFSTFEEQTECVVMHSTNGPSNISSIDTNYRPNYRRNYNISRSINLSICAINSTSTETTAFHSNNGSKLTLKQNETTDSEYMLYQLQYYQNVNVNEPTLTIANENKPHIQKKQIDIIAPKSYKMPHSKWSPSLKALSELSEMSYNKDNKNSHQNDINFLHSVAEDFDIIEAQKALQAAYEKGFAHGFSTAVQFPLEPTI